MADILVLGATGFTGKLITRYLYAHPAYRSNANKKGGSKEGSDTFTFALGARSLSKLKSEVAGPLSLTDDVMLIEVDVRNVEDLERALGVSSPDTSSRDVNSGASEPRVKVVVNTVGPYWKWGSNVVKACATHGVHYVDLTGETVWIKQIIKEFDFFATKTHAVIIPSCGMDSVPSDIAVYIANKTLKSISPSLELGHSVSAFKVKGALSGGTLSTLITLLEEVPRKQLKEANHDYALSPVKGRRNPGVKFFNVLPHLKPRTVGSIWGMASANRAVVHRTWGLLQANAGKLDKVATYGPNFSYEEFLAMPNAILAWVFSLCFAFIMTMVVVVTPFRWFVKRTWAVSGTGPSEQTMQNGSLLLTNVTSSTPSQSSAPVHVKTVIQGKGDPGYLLTSVMISEAALSLILPPSGSLKLPPLAAEGGILTPVTALGDVLIDRLERSGRFTFEYGPLDDKLGETKKTK